MLPVTVITPVTGSIAAPGSVPSGLAVVVLWMPRLVFRKFRNCCTVVPAATASSDVGTVAPPRVAFSSWIVCPVSNSAPPVRDWSW